ncbi:hypothetical protein [Singulisphaera sp. PoT]|uniref:hypothetical protein n=1 Tax=Singulisphaera sp. PoT TaxID=3411797 RepID=UPI003BF4AE2A
MEPTGVNDQSNREDDEPVPRASDESSPGFNGAGPAAVVPPVGDGGQTAKRPSDNGRARSAAEETDNSKSNRESGGSPKVGFQGLIEIEHKEICARLPRPFSVAEETSKNWTGLSLSGGGIRSACFNLGFLEGLDRLPFADPEQKDSSTRNHLEFFDYISSVSGGSYAAGHLAASMLDSAPPPRSRDDVRNSRDTRAWNSKLEPIQTPHEAPKPSQARKSKQAQKDKGVEWLGKVPLTSKTVPGWLWGLGVWFLGGVFQLLKSGALLVAFLAFLAFTFRMLDAPASNRFWSVVGLRTDLTRGFVPFWSALGVFLMAYWINMSTLPKIWTSIWLLYAFGLLSSYVAFIWNYYDDIPGETEALSYYFHYGFLIAALVVPVVACVYLLFARPFHWLDALLFPQVPEEGGRSGEVAAHPSEEPTTMSLKSALLVPVVVALFCFAGLVATGDIMLTTYNDTPEEFHTLQERGAWYGLLGDRFSQIAIWILGLISLGFLFPRNIFQSVRIVEDRAASDRGDRTRLQRWGQEPIFRVAVFLFSYGFVLLLVFVIYSLVARENVSGYSDWRESLPFETFHPSDFRNWEQAWERIASDARGPYGSPWKKLASRLMEARNDYRAPYGSKMSLSLLNERAEMAELRLLDSMPWIVRLIPPFMHLGPVGRWSFNDYQVDDSLSRLYELYTRQDRFQLDVGSRIARSVLQDPALYTLLPKLDQDRLNAVDVHKREGFEKHWNNYLKKAKALEALSPGPFVIASGAEPPRDNAPKTNTGRSRRTAFEASVGNNNRAALGLYLPDQVIDRQSKRIFAWVVWREDQWTRLRIAGLAGLLWLLCCAVDVNSFSLQKFYRGHVIDSWVRIEQGKERERWLHRTKREYRGHEFGPEGSSAPESQVGRRAPLLLIHATLEGNRSLGEEPDLPGNVFTFSPVASGSSSLDYWLTQTKSGPPKQPFARRNLLDIGNIVATSGAFLSPGTVANPALSAVLHLLNIQTGYWVFDPDRFASRNPMESLKFHVFQSLGIDCDGDSRYMLTDGAHVENLGLYALISRRCSLIVASDCSQEDRTEEPQRRFNALVQVLQQAGADGIEIGPFLSSRAYRVWRRTRIVPGGLHSYKDCRRTGMSGLDLIRPRDPESEPREDSVTSQEGENGDTWSRMDKPRPSTKKESQNGDNHMNGDTKTRNGDPPPSSRVLERLSQEHFLFAELAYPDGKKGLLVYVRPTLTGDEGDGLLHGVAHSRFPDDDPMDQFYTPAKMTTYRLLGRHIAQELMHDPIMREVLQALVSGRTVPQECGPDPDGGPGLDGVPAPDGGPNPKVGEANEICRGYCGPLAGSCRSNRQRRFWPQV